MSVCVCVSDVEVEGGKRFERRREWTTTAFERGTDSRPTRARARTIYSQDFTDRLRQQMEEDNQRQRPPQAAGNATPAAAAAAAAAEAEPAAPVVTHRDQQTNLHS